MIKLESCHSNVANFPQVLPKWVIGRKETVTKRGQIWFSHHLSADLESELYNNTDSNHVFMINEFLIVMYSVIIISEQISFPSDGLAIQ